MDYYEFDKNKIGTFIKCYIVCFKQTTQKLNKFDI